MKKTKSMVCSSSNNESFSIYVHANDQSPVCPVLFMEYVLIHLRQRKLHFS